MSTQKLVSQCLFTLFTIAPEWKQAKCSSVEKWVNKTWYGHTMEYYVGIKRNKGLTQATPWMFLENIMLSERGQ